MSFATRDCAVAPFAVSYKRPSDGCRLVAVNGHLKSPFIDIGRAYSIPISFDWATVSLFGRPQVTIYSLVLPFLYAMEDENRGQQIAAIGYTFAVISSIATILRIYCRGWVIKTFAADDWLAVIAQVCNNKPPFSLNFVNL